jgi:hypothetical protein
MEKVEDKVEDNVEDKSNGTGSGHGADSTKDKEESGGVQEGDTATTPPNRGPARGWSRQKRATWVEVVVARGVNIPAVFGLLGLKLNPGGQQRTWGEMRGGAGWRVNTERGGGERGEVMG